MHSHLLRQIAIALLLSAIFAISACKPRTTARPSATDPTGTEAPVTAKQPDSSSAPVPTATANSTKVAVDINVGLTAHPLPARAATTGKRFDELPIETTGISFAANWTPPENYGVEIYKTLPGGSVCVGDYDNDGRPDIYLNQPDIGSQLYRNLGNLRFEDVTEATVGNHPHGLGASFVDIDNDGDLDLYVCNNEHPNQLFINEGNSNSVERAKAYGLDFSGSSIMMSFCDYDRDGDLDAFLVTNRKEPKSPIPDPKPGPDGIYRMPPEHREYKDVIIPKDGNARIVMAAQFDHSIATTATVRFQKSVAKPVWTAAILGCHRPGGITTTMAGQTSTSPTTSTARISCTATTAMARSPTWPPRPYRTHHGFPWVAISRTSTTTAGWT